jgi:hypothetical protein
VRQEILRNAFDRATESTMEGVVAELVEVMKDTWWTDR